MYCAVIVWGEPATVSVDVLNWADPPAFRVTGGPAFDPSMTNWTVPVGIPEAGATGPTVAVNVTVCPGVDGLADDVTVVVVLALLTAIAPLVPVMAALTVSVPVMVCGPAVLSVALKLPAPLVSVLLAGNTAPPSVLVKWTVPA